MLLMMKMMMAIAGVRDEEGGDTRSSFAATPRRCVNLGNRRDMEFSNGTIEHDSMHRLSRQFKNYAKIERCGI